MGPQMEARSYGNAGSGHQHTPGRPTRVLHQLPPPNVTGTLHMGHAFNQTIMDASRATTA